MYLIKKGVNDMYINEIFKSRDYFIETLMKDFNVKRDEIGVQENEEDFDDLVFICSEDDSVDANFWYMKGNSGRIIIVEESIMRSK